MRYGKYSRPFHDIQWSIDNIVFSIEEYIDTYILKQYIPISMVKQITSAQFNELSEDIITKLNSDSMMTLRSMGYINPSDVIHALMDAQNVEMIK